MSDKATLIRLLNEMGTVSGTEDRIVKLFDAVQDELTTSAETAEAIVRGMFPLWIAVMSYAEHGRAADLNRIRNYYNGRDNPLTGEQMKIHSR